MRSFTPPSIFRMHLLLLGVVISFISPVSAQTPAAPAKLPVIEVVSIRETVGEPNNMGFNNFPRGIDANAVPLTFVLKEAYGLYMADDDLLEGLPPWAKTQRFDIRAQVADADVKALQNLSREQRGELLRGILADRFHLVAHLVMREQSLFALTVDSHGSKLSRSAAVKTSEQAEQFPACETHCMTANRDHVVARAITIQDFVQILQLLVKRPVADETGLKGSYDLVLHWNADTMATADNGAAVSADVPDLFGALQEQLGLRLILKRGPVSALVVDHVDKPSPN